MRKYTRSIILVSCLFAAGVSSTFAGSYDLREKTPEVQNAITGRQNRFSELKDLKAKGVLGENNKGYVEVLENTAGAGAAAQAENSDRKVLYKAIVDQNNLGPQGMAQVEMVFAEVQRDKADPGEKIQTPSGAWTQR